MDNGELLGQFSKRLDQFAKHRGYIEKAQAQAGRFSESVIERVVVDNTGKCVALSAEILPMVVEVNDAIAGLLVSGEEIRTNVASSQLALEELELRSAIGELDDGSFGEQSTEVRKVVETADTKLTKIQESLGAFQAELTRWESLSDIPGIATAVAVQDVPGQEPDLLGDAEGGGAPLPAPAAEEAPDEPAEVAVEVSSGEHVLVEDERDPGSEIELDEPAPSDVSEAADGRRAILIYQEGTAEEQIYSFSSDRMRIGRGRAADGNACDVQIKNDAKVSRHHCTIVQNDDRFHVEDNKSANGTLVNGELVTERRLFGGEEVIIGETFFRFRVLD
jgi:hypothetical protein